jgi:hypothetical protein
LQGQRISDHELILLGLHQYEYYELTITNLPQSSLGADTPTQTASATEIRGLRTRVRALIVACVLIASSSKSDPPGYK